MSFRDIERKMFRANIKRYRLYFISNIIAAAIFYAYAAIFTNEEFMDSNIVDPIISSNILAPSVVVAVFILFFIPYTYHTVDKFRKKDLGIFISIGMPEKEIRKIIIYENTIIEFVSLAIGLILGTILSMAFHFIIIDVLCISNIHMTFNLKSYGVTILLFLVVYIITLITGFISELKYSVADYLKFSRKSNEGMKGNVTLLVLGFIIISCAITAMFIGYDDNTSLISMAILFVGFYVVIMNSMCLISMFKKYFKKSYYKNLIFISNLKHDFSKTKKVFIMMIILVSFSGFLIILAFNSMPSIINDSMVYNPYDISYASIFDENGLEGNELENIVANRETELKEEKELSFYRNGAFNIFSVSEVNKVCDRDYSVEEGKFIRIYPFYMDDGYGHDEEVKEVISKISIERKAGSLELDIQESNIDVLVRNISSLAAYQIIVNDNDYEKIRQDNLGYFQGNLHLFSFEDWTKTDSIVKDLESKLSDKNNISDLNESRLFKVSSKINSFNKAKQSNVFLLIVLTFMSILLLLAANVMIHFKLVMDMENERVYYLGLSKIGMTAVELGKIIKNKLKSVFLIPTALASVIACIYSYEVSVMSRIPSESIIYEFLTIGVIFLIEFIIYAFYEKYFKRLVCS